MARNKHVNVAFMFFRIKSYPLKLPYLSMLLNMKCTCLIVLYTGKKLLNSAGYLQKGFAWTIEHVLYPVVYNFYFNMTQNVNASL